MLAGHSVIACFFAVTPLAPARELANLLHGTLARAELVYGVSVLPQECGAWVRVLCAGPGAVATTRRWARPLQR